MAERLAPNLAPLPAADPVVRAVGRWLAAGYVDRAAPLLVACSGGADSLALAAATLTASTLTAATLTAATLTASNQAASNLPPSARQARPGRTEPRKLAAAIIDHDLQEGSAAIAEEAAELLRAMGYRTVVVRKVAVGADGGLEAAARDARYHALASIRAEAAPGGAVLLAHTADDQAETVLLGLGRGSGPRSIAGMAPWSAPWGRPLLGVRRADTEHACAAIGAVPWQDPHNANPKFTRVRLRREVVPLLDEVLSGGVVPALARTAALMADDLAALDAVADHALATVQVPNGGSADGGSADGGDVDCAALAEWPSAVRRRVLRLWVRQRTGITALTFAHLVALEDCVIHGFSGWQVRLPGAVDVVRRGKRLTVPAAAEGRAPRGDRGLGGMAGW